MEIKAIKITQGFKLPMAGVPYGQDFGSLSLTFKGELTEKDIEKAKIEIVEKHRKSLEELLTKESKGVVDALVEKGYEEKEKQWTEKLELARTEYKKLLDKFNNK